MHTKLPAPFGWIGGKSKLADDIVARFPSHKRYVEVFGGALNVFYAKPRSPIEVVNDINGDLINLHRTIKNYPASLQAHLSDLPVSRELFYDIKQELPRTTNKIKRAAYYYYLLTQSFGSKGDNFGMHAKSCRTPKSIYRSWKPYARRLRYVTVENMSFDELIETYDSEDTLFYCDPPYVSTESYYKNTGVFDIEEHKKLAYILKSVKGKFFVSYNDCELVRTLYDGFNIEETKTIEYTLGKNVHGRKKAVKEVFITNYSRQRYSLF